MLTKSQQLHPVDHPELPVTPLMRLDMRHGNATCDANVLHSQLSPVEKATTTNRATLPLEEAIRRVFTWTILQATKSRLKWRATHQT